MNLTLVHHLNRNLISVSANGSVPLETTLLLLNLHLNLHLPIMNRCVFHFVRGRLSFSECYLKEGIWARSCALFLNVNGFLVRMRHTHSSKHTWSKIGKDSLFCLGINRISSIVRV